MVNYWLCNIRGYFEAHGHPETLKFTMLCHYGTELLALIIQLNVAMERAEVKFGEMFVAWPFLNHFMCNR